MILDPIYPITDDRNPGGAEHVEQAQAFIAGGVRTFQVREKQRPDRRFYDQLVEIRRLCRESGTLLIVNDRVDLALACEADGVHLGQEDLPVEAARKMLGNKFLIGVSTHNREQFDQACRLPVDYIALGPVFRSPTQPGLHPPLGPEFIREAAPHAPCPLVAIGGITLDNAKAVWEAGAHSVAVISDLSQCGNRTERIRRFLRQATRGDSF